MTVKRILTGIIAVFLFFLIQSSVFKDLAHSGALPNLLLILTVSYGYLRGEQSAMIAGFFSGLLLDIFGMNVLGLYALIYVYLGYLAGTCHTWYEPVDFRIPLAMIFTGDILLLLLEFVLFFVLNGDFGFRYYLTGKALPELAATMIISIPVYPLLLWIEERFVNVDPAEKKKKEDWNVADLAEAERKDGIN